VQADALALHCRTNCLLMFQSYRGCLPYTLQAGLKFRLW
jgi:hypothetical protein